MKHIILTGASLSSENKGINALTLGAIASLIENNPGIGIEIFNQDSDEDSEKSHDLLINGKKYSITEHYVWSSKFILSGLLHLVFFFLPGKLKEYLFVDKLKIFYALPVLLNKKWRKKKIYRNDRRLKELVNADYVINLAEGDSFSDIYGLHVFLRHSLDKYLAISHKRKLIIFPQTIGPFTSVPGKMLAKNVLRRADLVYIREDQSFNHVTDLCGSLPHFRPANDMAFLMSPEKVDNPEFDAFIKSGTIVGINVSGFLHDVSIGKDMILGSDVDYPRVTERIIQTLLSFDRKVKIVFIPHVGIEDHPLSVKIAERLSHIIPAERIYVVDSGYSAPQLKYLISKLDFFTGARMHSCIAALSTGVPTVPQAYSYKFKGITGKIGLDQYVIDLKKDTEEEMVDKLKNAYKNSAAITRHLHKVIPAIISEVRECGKLP
ncbi:MAG: polysaccharide pyruvyl transferase family protein [Spirochaetes bacterium]|nr:polysaccharide pyruvyl transferase family protein [Spirochaetota bacterium]